MIKRRKHNFRNEKYVILTTSYLSFYYEWNISQIFVGVNRQYVIALPKVNKAKAKEFI